jgi:DHA2 family multidrug resistance protein
VGGSFGVAIFGTVLTQRISYHAGIYSQAANPNSPEYQNIVMNLQHFIQDTVGGAGKEVVQRANAMIVQNLTSQAFIQGINDDFLLSAIVTASLIIPLIFLKIKKNKKREKIEIME